MKKILITVLAAFALSATGAAFAADVPSNEKDECLLVSKGCRDQVDSIQQRIKKINVEIKKGKKVYSAEDLKKLKQKLKETEEVLNNLEKPGH
jgi:peptidoglycan hydrolase CwlO-like protein